MAIVASLPVTLQNGTTADATQVMANFNAIVSAVNANAANSGINTNITQLQGLTVPVAVNQGGTGQNILTPNAVLLGNGTSGVNATAPGVAGTALVSAGAGANPIFTALYPVGSLYLETTGVNPGTTFGFGVWSAYAAGQALVGVGSFTDGNGTNKVVTAGQQFGEYQHTLTTPEMPSHNHTDSGHTHTVDDTNGGGGSTPLQYARGGFQEHVTTSTGFANIQNTGGGGAHNNIQPSIGVYVWQRTA